MSIELESFDKEKAKSEIKILVEKYEREKSNGKLESYSEEQTKNDFILRLFKALGWDVYNDHSNTLTAEEKASRGRVDYGFRIGDIPKFFLEAKSFRAGVDKDEYAFQSINYSWLKGCTWAVLTNFEKLIIFNAEWKEKLAVNCLFISLNYVDFLINFDQLYLLSREAFTKNLLDKEAEKWHKKIKKTPIDQQLLQDLMKFRESLTQSIMRRNSSVSLTDEELDESVQKILDRVIFIRTVEDRQIEPPHLRPLIREDHKGNLWKKLAELYRYFDDTYDSNLFSPHECEKLIIGDEELETIIRGLHETEDGSVQYDFGAINVDVLGNVYEQYLGHILKKTKKSATIQDGASKRKEQGIYYTPTYIVDYIVKNTVATKTDEMGLDWKRIKILDPACGSGSFLIKAFDYLTSLDKNLEKTEEMKKELYGTHIATERFGYLKNNIFGVDLDTKAVEIAQLNLMIRATEKKERLPSLQQNIKNGNSLVEDSSIVGDKAFEWKSQFSDIINNGGFDVIIGNPPYVRQEELTPIKPYLEANYETYNGTADLFVYFFERELKLLKEGGYFGMIVSNKWLRAGYGKSLRKFVSQFWIEQLIDFGDLKIFPDATIYPSIIIMRKIKKPNPKIKICKVETLDFDSLDNYIQNHHFTVNQSELNDKEWTLQRTDANEFLNKLRITGIPIEEYVGAKIYRGILTGFNDAFIIDDKTRANLIAGDPKSADVIKSLLIGSEIKRYGIFSQSKYLIFIPWHFPLNREKGVFGVSKDTEELFKKQYPVIYNYLTNYKEKLENRNKDETGIRYEWYALQRCAATYYEEFEKPKIVWGNLTTKASFAFDNDRYYLNAPACILPTNSKYVLGILNSKLMSYFLKSISAERQGGYIEQKPVYVSQVPIKKPSEHQEEKINQLVEKMLSLNERINKMGDKNTNERAKIEEEIKKVDSEIDELVYKIYGLDDAERKIVEDSTK